jgi:hypothetical protein
VRVNRTQVPAENKSKRTYLSPGICRQSMLLQLVQKWYKSEGGRVKMVEWSRLSGCFLHHKQAGQYSFIPTMPMMPLVAPLAPLTPLDSPSCQWGSAHPLCRLLGPLTPPHALYVIRYDCMIGMYDDLERGGRKRRKRYASGTLPPPVGGGSTNRTTACGKFYTDKVE